MLKNMLLFIFISISLYAQNESSFPKEWRSYEASNRLSTTLKSIPKCDADISNLAPIYQEMIYTYCEKGNGDVSIFTTPNAREAFISRDGVYPDGAQLVLHLKKMKTLFVTTYKDNKPFYSIYKENGSEISSPTGTGFNPNDCRSCHTGYSAFCLNGQCATQK